MMTGKTNALRSGGGAEDDEKGSAEREREWRKRENYSNDTEASRDSADGEERLTLMSDSDGREASCSSF